MTTSMGLALPAAIRLSRIVWAWPTEVQALASSLKPWRR
jgi:hypothetical protein